ncbi:MAG: efflux RND transporter periplasmic adaptor subunit, partial [Candidatus Sericytochromatia bacterium]|nr:efflux RND transporter periplasmic adaptor subunit [Candidatus Sericytochromatia bacterium]
MSRTPLRLVCFTALLTWGCWQQPHAQEEKATFAVTSPLRKDTELTKEYVAQVRAIQHIELRAIERGYLQSIFVDEGQQLHSGQKMFQIMPLVYQAEVGKAAAEAKLTEIEYQNTEMLAKRNIVAPSELALAKARVDRANATLSLANTHRQQTEIRAPFDGLMGRFQVRKGSLVGEGDLLTTLSDNSTVWAY